MVEKWERFLYSAPDSSKLYDCELFIQEYTFYKPFYFLFIFIQLSGDARGGRGSMIQHTAA